jgi:hypothetical protein
LAIAIYLFLQLLWHTEGKSIPSSSAVSFLLRLSIPSMHTFAMAPYHPIVKNYVILHSEIPTEELRK